VTALPERSTGDTRVFPARLRGVDLQCRVLLNRAEHDHRERNGLGAITDRNVLEVLLGIEPGVETATAGLPARVRPVLRRAGDGAVVLGRGTVTRTASVPLTVECVTVTDTDPARGLARASRFGPYCARVLSLSRLPGDPVELLLEATYLGIGIAVPDDPEVVAAAVFRPVRFTAASWMFAEAAYEQFLGHALSTIGGMR
jgi:hypothetical protein